MASELLPFVLSLLLLFAVGSALHMRLVILQQRIDELLTLVRQNDIAMSDLDNRVADLQEARDGG